MTDQRSRHDERVLVCDDGQWYDAGALVLLRRTPAVPGKLALLVTSQGDREVLSCQRILMGDQPMLVVTLLHS